MYKTSHVSDHQSHDTYKKINIEKRTYNTEQNREQKTVSNENITEKRENRT